MKLIKIILIAVITVACQNPKNEAGNIENAKYHSSKNSVNPALFNENMGFVFTGYSFHIGSYLSPSFLAAHTISKVEVIQLNETIIANYISGISFDTLNADHLFKLSLNKDGQIDQLLEKGCGEYETKADVSQLEYNKQHQIKNIETQTQYGIIQSKYSYNVEKKIDAIREYSNGNIDVIIHYVKDSTSKVTYRIKIPTTAPYSSIQIIKYDGVISDNESLIARKKLIEKIEGKQGVFANIKDVNSSLDIISYKNGLKVKEEIWYLKKDAIQSYTNYFYSDSGALIKASGKHTIGEELFHHSKSFLYRKNGDLINIAGVYEKPETLDHGTVNWNYDFVYDNKGFLLELIERMKRGRFEQEISKVLQFQYY